MKLLPRVITMQQTQHNILTSTYIGSGVKGLLIETDFIRDEYTL